MWQKLLYSDNVTHLRDVYYFFKWIIIRQIFTGPTYLTLKPDPQPHISPQVAFPLESNDWMINSGCDWPSSGMVRRVDWTFWSTVTERSPLLQMVAPSDDIICNCWLPLHWSWRHMSGIRSWWWGLQLWPTKYGFTENKVKHFTPTWGGTLTPKFLRF